MDSLIEIGASIVVLWELSGTGAYRQIQTALALLTQHRPDGNVAGIIWSRTTAVCMFILAIFKTRTGRTLDNPVLRTEGQVTWIAGLLACWPAGLLACWPAPG